MMSTFEYCSNLTGNIYIQSENIKKAYNCFGETNAIKNVYIKMNTTSDETHRLYCYCNELDESDLVFVKSFTSGSKLFYANGVVHDKYKYYLNRPFYAYIGESSSENSRFERDDRYDTDILYPSGSPTNTYMSFTDAGYSEETMKDGVMLRDINSNYYTLTLNVLPSDADVLLADPNINGSIVNVADYEYQLSNNHSTLTLGKYIGSNTNIIMPNI
jgi:hypothetical protein